MIKSVELDRINRRILEELQRDARITNLVLSERVGLSASACLKRVQALEAAGCIYGYVTSLNLDRIAHYVKAYLLIEMQDMTQATVSAFNEHIPSLTNVVDCMRVGGNPDYIALVFGSDVAEISAMIDGLMAQDLKIARINLHVVLAQPKWFEGYPIDGIKWKERT